MQITAKAQSLARQAVAIKVGEKLSYCTIKRRRHTTPIRTSPVAKRAIMSGQGCQQLHTCLPTQQGCQAGCRRLQRGLVPCDKALKLAVSQPMHDEVRVLHTQPTAHNTTILLASSPSQPMPLPES